MLKPAQLTKKVLNTEREVRSLKTGISKLRAEVFAAQDEDRNHFQNLYTELDAKLNLGAGASCDSAASLDMSSRCIKYTMLIAVCVPVLIASVALIFNVIYSS